MQGYTNARSISVIPLSVTENGTYTATLGSAYSPVTVNVSGGGDTGSLVFLNDGLNPFVFINTPGNIVEVVQ